MDNGDSAKQTEGISGDVPLTNFKSAKDILKESIESIKELAPIYKDLGWSGFFGVSSVVIALLTLVLSFLTGTQMEGKWYGGITLYEEMLFLFISALFAVIGLILLRNLTIESLKYTSLQ